MGIEEKIKNAKNVNWVSDIFSETEQKTIVELAKISAQIQRSRIEKGMTQQEFAEYMGVSQGMISKWESREYNFTIKTLFEICEKLDMNLNVNLENSNIKANYTVIKWDSNEFPKKKKRNSVVIDFSREEAIA